MKCAEGLLVKKEEIIYDLFGKYEFHLDLKRGDLESSFYYFLPERYESETQRYIKDHLKPGMTAVDIGAHMGFFSILMADCVGARGSVYSFEPEEMNFKKLQMNLSSNRLTWVTPFHTALSDRSGNRKLMIHANSSGNYLDLAENAMPQNPGQATQDVSTMMLDEFMENQKLNEVDLIKIDAEKSEALILHGGKRTLESGAARRIICEAHTTKIDKTDEVRAIFYSYGCRSAVLNSKLSRKPYLSELKPDEPIYGLQNLIFEKKP